MATTTLNLYWDLAEHDVQKRKSAAALLIRSLAEFQEKHESTLKPNQVADTEEKLKELCAEDVSYAVLRLIRGLSSSRQSARVGFSLALTELLSIVDIIAAKLALDLLFKCTEITGSMSREESRNTMFGRLFGVRVIVAAGMLTRPSTSMEDVERILDCLFELSNAKSYLREVCYQVVIATLPDLKNAPYADEAGNKVVHLFLKGSVSTTDKLDLALAIQQHMPGVDLSANFTGWMSQNVLEPSNLPRLANLLKEVPVDEEEPQSEWKPKLHSVWDRLLAAYLQPTSWKDAAPFEEFWNITVDNVMFEHSATHGRKYWGFQLVNKVLPRLSPDRMPFLFTENFMRAFINNLSSTDRFLNKAAKHTATVIYDVAKANKQAGFTLITQLLGKHGHKNFDRITKTKTVDDLLTTLDNDGIQSYLEFLAQTIFEQEDIKRDWALRQMALLVTNKKIPKEEKWVTQVVRFLARLAFFDIKTTKSSGSFFEGFHKPSSPISDATRDLCKDRFQAILVALSTMPPINKLQKTQGSVLKTRKYNGLANDGELWVYHVQQVLASLEKDTKHFTFRVELSDESKAERKKALQTVDKLRSQLPKEDAHESLERGFESLLLNMVLYLLIDEEEAHSVLSELLECYERTFKVKKAKKGKKEAPTGDDQPEPVEVIIDILIGFLNNESNVLKSLAEQVFEIFSHKMTKKSLFVLLDILSTNDNKGDGEDLFSDEEDDDVEEMEMDNSADNSDEDEEDEEESSSEVEDEDEDAESEVDEELRQKVEEALKSAKLHEDNDEEADLNDDEMEAFDDKLAEIFRQKKLEKKAKKSMQQQVLHFKNNVMDLVEIFVIKNPTSPLVIDVIVPLLNVARSTPDKSATSQFVDKVAAFLRNKLPRATERPKVSDETLVETMQAVHDFAKNSSSEIWSEVYETLSLYLMRCTGVVEGSTMSAETQQAVNKLLEVYSNTLAIYMSKRKTRVRTKMFELLMERYARSAWPLLDTLIVYINPAKSASTYKHAMACRWIERMVRRCVGKKGEDTHALFLQLVPRIAQAVTSAVDMSLKGESNALDYKSMKQLMEMTSSMIQTHKRVAPDTAKLSSVWDTSLFERVASHDDYLKCGPGVKNVCNASMRLLKDA